MRGWRAPVSTAELGVLAAEQAAPANPQPRNTPGYAKVKTADPAFVQAMNWPAQPLKAAAARL